MSGSGRGLGIGDRNKGPVLPSFAEFNNAVGQSKERIIFSDTNIFTGMIYSAALTDNDVAGYRRLAAKDLYAQTLAVRVASVLYTAFPFFMCHGL